MQKRSFDVHPVSFASTIFLVTVFAREAHAFTPPANGVAHLVNQLDNSSSETRAQAARSLCALQRNLFDGAGDYLDAARKEPTSKKRHTVRPDRRALDKWVSQSGPWSPEEQAALARGCLRRSLAHDGSLDTARILAADLVADSTPLGDVDLGQTPPDALVAAIVEIERAANNQRRGWATVFLDSMGRRTPSDVIQLKDIPATVAVVRAYGKAKALDALPVVLSLISADSDDLRKAARDAVRGYSSDGLWKTREAYSALTSQSADGLDANTVADKLFEASDRIRQREANTLIDEALIMSRSGKLPEAIAQLDRVLARYPTPPRAPEVASLYLTQAELLVATDRNLARNVLERARRLVTDDAFQRRLDARVAFLDAEESSRINAEAGHALYDLASRLDPSFAEPRQRLNAIEEESESQRRKWQWGGLGALAVILFGAVAIVVVPGLRRKHVAGVK